MRSRRLTILAAMTIAAAAPIALANAAPHAFSFDGPRAELVPVAGQEGAYVVASRLWSTTQQVHWFTAGPPAAIGSMPAPRFARMLAARASSNADTAPIAHVAHGIGARAQHFLATVTVAAATLGPVRNPSVRVVLTALRPDQLQAVATGGGLFAPVAQRCLAVPAASPGAACSTPMPAVRGEAPAGRTRQASRLIPVIPTGAPGVATLRNVTTRFIVTDPDGI